MSLYPQLPMIQLSMRLWWHTNLWTVWFKMFTWFHADTCCLFFQFFQSPHASLRKLALGCINQYIVVMPSVRVLPPSSVYLSQCSWLIVWIHTGTLYVHGSVSSGIIQPCKGPFRRRSEIGIHRRQLLIMLPTFFVRELHIMARYLFTR
jgi:hypothetical protein